MAGFYIHIPFCKLACYYCNFHFSTSEGLRTKMIFSLIKEIELRSKMLEPTDKTGMAIVSSVDEKIETIYFGGGTPSLLSPDEISSIICAIKKNYYVLSEAEITLEANPDDIHSENLAGWKNASINRLSIGIQSFIDRDLKWMNRVHNSKQALNSMRLSRKAGFKNFSIDLIFGTPGLSDEEWRKNIQTAIDLRIPHISAYALTVEPKTALQKMIELKKKENVNNEQQAKQFKILMEMMSAADYEHYEISNFAKEGFRSRHNSSYWQGEKYIGIGPSAHSYNGNERSWNISNNRIYIQSLEQNQISSEKEILTPSQKLNEYVMTSLRTIEGMNLIYIGENFSLNERARVEQLFENKIEKDQFSTQGDRIILTDRGKLFADRIAVELFL